MSKRFILFALFCCALFAGAAIAQDLQTEIAITRTQTEADRQAIVAATLDLEETDAEAFWPLYKAYRDEMAKPADRGWKFLIDLASKMDSLSNDDASKLMDEWFGIEKQMLDIKMKHAKLMSKKVPPALVAQFFQIDNKIDTLLRLDAAANIPLITPAKK
jgi:hypothetical protein